jgi:hypothetical protein
VLPVDVQLTELPTEQVVRDLLQHWLSRSDG